MNKDAGDIKSINYNYIIFLSKLRKQVRVFGERLPFRPRMVFTGDGVLVIVAVERAPSTK